MRIAWSAAETAQLRALWPQQTIAGIAAELGRSRSSVAGQIERMKWSQPRNDWTAAEIDYIAGHWRQDSAAAIGAVLGRSRSSVIGKINRLRLLGATLESKPHRPRPRRPPPPKPEAPPKQPAKPAPRMIQCPCQLVELDDINCIWPYGDPRERGFYFCGAVTFNGFSYCSVHQRESKRN